ncbi:MAG: hypothetical protein ACLQK8_27780 [Streptosporangiaceae bacterium]|nr:hypothetical protein [Streptosporangiaceae bacterium]
MPDGFRLSIKAPCGLTHARKAEPGSYAVDAVTLPVRPLSFAPGSDINFSATVLAGP